MFFLLIGSALLLFILYFYFNTTNKGENGEKYVSNINNKHLNRKKYFIFNNIMLKFKNGKTTQIDHIIISKFGIFILETKNLSGKIFGHEREKEWSYFLAGKEYPIKNPLHQNFKHLKAVEEVLDVNEKDLKSIIVFIGSGDYMSSIENVFNDESYINYIRSFKEEIYSEDDVSNFVDKINLSKMKNSKENTKKHIKSLKR